MVKHELGKHAEPTDGQEAASPDLLWDLVIIGGGPAGLAAAVSAWDAGCRKLLIIERDRHLGGILQQCIHNGFGLHYFKEELTGPEYADRFVEKVSRRGIPYQCDTMVISLETMSGGHHLLTTVNPLSGVRRLDTRAVVLAMGCRERPRGALGIPGTRCAGIMTTGTAQRLVNLEGYLPGRRIVILGSGDIGLIMARRMTFEGAEVLACVEIMPYSSGLTRNVVQCLQDFDIPLLLNHTVVDIQGKDRLTGVTVAAVDPSTRQPIPGTEQQMDCDTLLLSVGLIPENELSRQAGVTIDPTTMGPSVDEKLSTSRPGIFACGNVLHVHDLVDEVSAEAAKAGRAAVAWLNQEQTGASVPIEIRIEGDAAVRGLVPQVLHHIQADEPLTITFRPDRIYRKVTLRVHADDQLIHSQKKTIVAPGEMVVLTVKPGAIPLQPFHSLKVSLEGAIL